MRCSEVCSLPWDAINLDEGTITIERKKAGNSSTHSFDRDELRDLRKLHKARSGPFVFESERGGPVSHDVLVRIVKEASVLANIPEYLAHPHALRHAAGYYLANQGGHELRVIQDYLGHKTPAMAAHYSALAPGKLASVRVR
jgi:integrase